MDLDDEELEATKQMYNKKKKTSDIELGNVYDINKQLVEQVEKEISPYKMNEKKKEIAKFLEQKQNFYYMLLCHEQRDYTLFNLKGWFDYEKGLQVAKELEETLLNRGKIKSIDLTEDKGAIEIWVSINNESYCYYFFPYDAGVIEIE